MEFIPPQRLNTSTFQQSDAGDIDATRYTLYEVLFDPRLDEYSMQERWDILDSFIDDANRNRFTTNRRFALDGTKPERRASYPGDKEARLMINFGSNDYLNMTQHPAVIQAAKEALDQYGAGSGASGVASGRTQVMEDLETEIADTFGYEKALVFSTGYMANTGVLTALLRSQDVAIVDMFAHASIQDGVAHKNKVLFKHNDLHALETALKKVDGQYANKIVVVDGVYSMDGDIAPLPDIAALCKKYHSLLMVDEAHAFGVIGNNGLGIADHFQLPPDTIDVLVGTLSKAIGSSGGFVTGKEALVNYIQWASRPYFFSTSPFIASMAAALASIRIIKESAAPREKLWANIRHFNSLLVSGGFDLGQAETAIFSIILGNHWRVLDVVRRLDARGILTNGIPYPAVARKQTRIRMTVSAGMRRDQLDTGYRELCAAMRDSETELVC